MSDNEKIQRTRKRWEDSIFTEGVSERSKMKRYVAMRLADGTAPRWYRPVALISRWWPNRAEREGLA